MKKIKHEFQKIYYNLDKILLLFFTLFVVMELVWIPLNSWIAEFLLSLTGHAYFSPTNFFKVFSANIFISILFILLFVVNVLVAYLELTLMFTGSRQLLDSRSKHLRDYLRGVREDMKQVIHHISLPKVIFLLFYVLALLPFLRRVLNIYYFNKLVIPEFIIDYLSKNNLLAVVLMLSFLSSFWLAARLMYAIPKIYFEHRDIKESISYSWEKTKGRRQISAYLKLLWTIILPVLVVASIGLLLFLVQVLVDRHLPTFAYTIALTNFVIFHLAYCGIIAIFITKFISLLMEGGLSSHRPKKSRHRLRLIIVLVSSLYFGLEGVLALRHPFTTLPVTISHRGVDNENGVQNTIESLEKTSRLKPDFVEMDIQETKDGQFVVMHDTNLKALTGNPGGTHDYTLAEMTAMTASENGQSAPVPSFDDYLDKADKLGQKLLVEIKVTNRDSNNLTKNFIKKYGSRLVAKGHQLHSLDYKVIMEARQANDKLASYLILPFNSIYPTTVANGYTMEYTSLDQNFMTQSWLRSKSVYAWTPNDEETMKRMMLLQVNGIITDQLSELLAVKEELKSTRRYADLFWLQVEVLLSQF